MICKRCVIEGRVQGVCYRATTLQKAAQIGVCGWVRNLANGDVEALIQGSAEQLREMQTWLWKGPSGAHVTRVQCNDAQSAELDSFTIKY